MDARAYWKRRNHEAWIRSNDFGTLTVKAILSMWIHPEELDDDAQIEALKGYYQNGTKEFISMFKPEIISISIKTQRAD